MEQALEELNRKKWDRTRPIMISCVVSMFTLLGSQCFFFFPSLSSTWYFMGVGISVLMLIMAIHFAWELEITL